MDLIFLHFTFSVSALLAFFSYKYSEITREPFSKNILRFAHNVMAKKQCEKRLKPCNILKYIVVTIWLVCHCMCSLRGYSIFWLYLLSLNFRTDNIKQRQRTASNEWKRNGFLSTSFLTRQRTKQKLYKITLNYEHNKTKSNKNNKAANTSFSHAFNSKKKFVSYVSVWMSFSR